MKIKYLFIIIFFFSFINLNAIENNLDKKFLPLKDFLILKYDLFIQKNLNNVFRGGGVTGVAFQNIDYKVKINEKNQMSIYMDALMDRKRYSSKKYFPKLKDCIQVRNKLLTNKYGYSFFSQKFNNLVDEDLLSNSIRNEILNISSLNESLKDEIIKNTEIKINIIHPNEAKNISCIGGITDLKLKSIN